MERFQTGDGCAIAYERSGAADKRTLVLAPSLGTSMALFDAQMAVLGEAFSIVRFDLRGHGASEGPAGGYSMDRLGRDVVELLDHLGEERAHFLGVSIGGMIGQWLGYRAPERIESLVLANTSAYMGPPSGWDDRIGVVQAQGTEAMAAPAVDRWFTKRFQQSDPTEVGRISDMIKATSANGYSGCCAAIRDMDLRPTAPLVAPRCLVIAGREDPATPPEHADFLCEQIKSAARVDFDAAHLSNVEQPSAFSAAVLSFLQ